MALQNTFYIVGIVFMGLALIVGFAIYTAICDIRDRQESLEKLLKTQNKERGSPLLNQIVETITSIAQDKFK